jgi:SAM-dependent methyltransferase
VLGCHPEGKPPVAGSVKATPGLLPRPGFYTTTWDTNLASEDPYTFYYLRVYRTSTWHYLARLCPGEKMLEYACGIAQQTWWMLRKYPRFAYTVADVKGARHMEFVRWRFRNSAVQIIEVDLTTSLLPLQDSYDLITCFGLLHVCPDPLSVVTHLIDHLAEGGRLVLDFPAKPDLAKQEGPYFTSAIACRNSVLDLLTQMKVLKPIRPARCFSQSITGWAAFGIYEKTQR